MIAALPTREVPQYTYISPLLSPSIPTPPPFTARTLTPEMALTEPPERWLTASPDYALTLLLKRDSVFRKFAWDLMSLNGEAEDDERPTQAEIIAQALYLTPLARLWLDQKWTPPRIATDGFGGIRLTWKEREREIRAVLPGEPQKARYIYWEDHGKYGAVHNFTPVTLFSFLDRLQKGEPIDPGQSAV